LGVIAFELLTGELPFPSQTLSESLVSRTRGHARAIESVDPDIPAWLARIVMRCLERNPADRYENADDIATDLLARDVCPFPPVGLTSGDLRPGTMIGSRYRIEAEAGEGGMGKVYRAMDLDLHRTVALKVVRPDLANSPETLDQLRHEISIASQISHKNVLRIHDLGEASGLRYVSMAWAEGEDLASLLKRTGPLSEERILELAGEICDGLEAAHEQGVSHRDLKPSNILLTAGGHACIADFGLAHSLTKPELDRTPSSSSSGTPRYMSPEQVDGICIDHRTDIYSLGLILYEMATGRIPFSDDSLFQTMTQRITDRPVSPKLVNPEISSHLAAVILKCLELDPKERYSSVRELLTELRKKTATEKAVEIVAPKPSKKLGWFLAAAALVVLAAVGVTWFSRVPNVPKSPPVNGKYVAVLPFRPLGSDPNLKYRAEGIADAVAARLSTLSSIHPISSSALEKVNLMQPEEAIAKQLGANLLVKGTVQSEGDQIKVYTQVYSTERRAPIWGKSYQRMIGDLFTLEDEISNDTENAFNVKPTIEERERAAQAPTQSLPAYDLYLKGRDILKRHRDAGSVKEALGLFEQARNQDDSFALAWTGVADASLALYRMSNNRLDADRALAAAQEARQRNPNLPEVHFALGSVYTATGRNAESVSEIKRALELSPNSDDGYLRLGRAYLATGQEQEGIAAYKKAVQLNPYYWWNHTRLGAAYYRLGKIDDAIREFKEQIQLNPANEDGYNNLGSAYLKKADGKKAIPQFEKAIEIHPTDGEYSNLATAYYQAGKYKEAIPIYQKALLLNPDQPDVVRNLGEAFARVGQEKEAQEQYERAMNLLYDQLAVNPRDADALGTLAMCFAGEKNTSRARQLIDQARHINSADSDLMYDQAYINAIDGRIPEALKALEGALEHGTSFEYVLADPDMKVLRDSAGFNALRKKFDHPSDGRRQ